MNGEAIIERLKQVRLSLGVMPLKQSNTAARSFNNNHSIKNRLLSIRIAIQNKK